LNSDLPLVPVTIKSTFSFLAYSTIADTIDVAVTITSVCSWILLILFIFSLILLNHCCASFLASSKSSFTASGVVRPLLPNAPADEYAYPNCENTTCSAISS
jgi:hypothetical protein